jgi:CheY-like chemotaxis protein
LARKILLADDSVTAQNMGRRILSDAGYDVTTVNNGSAALKKIAESKPDLIVLDVYMPGYGGLEVCQRLREAPETARIPVLLTVGKLEPFKADEARRVRADGFIVKPFEASELLTALTKLEDKIVPQSQPAKPSRFAKALAGAEDFASGKEFGDSETGWKNRLSIPPPQSKHRGAPPAEVREASSDRDVASYPSTVPRTEEQKPAEMKSGLEEALLSSLPQDVTPEEIAAIKAAAAAFNAPADESSFAPHRNYVEDPTPEPVTAETRLSEPGSESIPAQAESLATAEPTTIADAASAGDVPPETVPPPVAIVADSQTSPAFQAADAEAGKLADDEVAAALASLAPTNGHGDTAIDRAVDRWESAARDRDQDQVPVTMAVADAAQGFSGPRWIAEAVPLRDDEATLILEQEMEKAFAAFAAADAARMSFVSSPEPVAPVQVAEAPAFNSEAAYSPVEPVSNSESSESEPQEPMVADTAVISNEGSSAPESELNAVADSPSVDAVSDNVVPEVKESAAYAAAASAGSSTVDANIDAEAVSHATPMAESAETAPAAPEPGEGRGESELVAAWANWKQIRESVIGSQLTSQIADTVAELKETSIETQPEPQVDTAPATEEDSSEISNIVDSVLADLKPKLMAEIAKKMGKDKKK